MKKHPIFVSIIWLLAVAISLTWNITNDKTEHENLALQTARSFFKQIVLDRAWNAGYGGVYVPISDKVQPNPYLSVPSRDVVTTDGLKLTKINPAFMTRQIAELANSQEGVKFHITSLKPIRPENKATQWEAVWLNNFEQGVQEEYEIIDDSTGFQFRYMAPLLTPKPCLKCHAKQGYEEGDIRGGISITLPFTVTRINWSIWGSHLLGGLVGLLGIIFSGFFLERSRKKLVEKNTELEEENCRRRRVESELKQSEKLYRDLVETTAAVAWEVDLKTLNFTYVSPTVEEIFGYSQKDWVDFSFWASHIHPEDQEFAISFCQAETEKGKDHEFEYRFLDSAGRIVWVRDIVSVIRNSDNKPVALRGYFLDISKRKSSEQEKKKLEVKLQQAQKMESIGTLAGGIAHDFNNILTPIIGYATILQDHLSNNSQAQKYLDNMQLSANRAKELVSQILTFSRQEPLRHTPIQVDKTVKDVLKLIRATIPSNIEIQEDVAPNCGNVIADSSQIHQILMNLCTNAYYAMRESGGRLKVLLHPITVEQDEVVEQSDISAGNYLHLQVADTGHGINTEVLLKIFDPYFTTKPTGEGTGLGLSLVHGIVKSYGGNITVNSKIGIGTTFDIYLPVFENESILDEIPQVKSLQKGNETIMVVDDESMILEVQETLLKTLGYKVISFIEPEKALEYFKEHPGQIDLMITDIAMPKLTGDKLAQKVIDVRSDLPIIMCTGFSEMISEEKAKAIGVNEFLMKPVTVQDLAPLLRKIFDGST